MFVTLALVASASFAGAIRVVGTAPPWVTEAGGGMVDFRQMSDGNAWQELAAGRADVALVSVPSLRPPAGVGPFTRFPVGVYAVRVAYRLPGVNLKLDVKTACLIFAGKVRTWNDPQIAALNPQERLPELPIVTTAQVTPNAASRVFADACVQGGWWSPTLLKSSWTAGAVRVASSSREQVGNLNLTGAVGLLGPLEDATGVQVASLLTVGGTFSAPATGLGLADGTPLPASERDPLPPAQEEGAYPLRGLVWAVMLREQQYRRRTERDAAALAAFVRELQAGGNEVFSALPEAWRPEVKLTFGGKRLREDPPVGPPAP